ncbi:MAG: 4-hydroxy-tetrahydrodipicolinate reductase [Marinilabiliales bacterium]|nr:4-hydroxy-tetrahydrodipicolinate reductase [Marinilabiliales bacterium]
MKIALIGYGRMGKEIEQIALERGHTIVLKIDISNQEELTTENLSKADVAIEFTIPASALSNYEICFRAGVPVVSGTTGWLNKRAEVDELCRKLNGCFLYASNFSLGVNLFFELNRKLAAMMNHYPEYEVSMTEIHHTKKLDAPSGTAITLAEGILANNDAKKQWVLGKSENPEDLSIEAIRQDPYPGLHAIKYNSAVDCIEITHNAYNRKGFAIGAVLAAEFCAGKKGIFTLSDMLKL